MAVNSLQLFPLTRWCSLDPAIIRPYFDAFILTTVLVDERLTSAASITSLGLIPSPGSGNGSLGFLGNGRRLITEGTVLQGSRPLHC